MRDFVLVTAILGSLGLTLQYPFVGVLIWTWLTVMNPHMEMYGFATAIPFNLIVAIVTVVSWLLSNERKLPEVDGTFWAVTLLLTWMTFNSFFAVDPNWSWPLWDRTWRIFALGLLVGVMAMKQVRIHALIWVIVISIAYYGIKGGILTFVTGGTKIITGPAGAGIGDNNYLALAILMTLPLLNYLRLHTEKRWVRNGIIAVFLLMFVSVIGSYSRGAYLSLSALLVVGLLRSRNKFYYLAGAAILVVPLLYFMPQSFYDRLDTLGAVDQDQSFQARVQAWKVSYFFAVDHFPFGAGFGGQELRKVYSAYFAATPHAAHSIYFQVLGEHGFIGLAIYLLVLLLTFVNCHQIRKAAKGRPELAWAYDLATMIQLSLFVFGIGGAALSMAYYDVAVVWIGLMPALKRLVQQQTDPKLARLPRTQLLSRPTVSSPAAS